MDETEHTVPVCTELQIWLGAGGGDEEHTMEETEEELTEALVSSDTSNLEFVMLSQGWRGIRPC